MDEQIRDLIGDYRAGRIERADFLKWAALLGIGAAAAVAEPRLARAADAAAPTRGGTIRVGATAPVSIDPPLLVDGAGIAIAQQVGEYLVNVGPDLVPRPQLATAWTPSQGGQVWTVTIRKGVTFQSGRALTADDVVATFRRLVDPKGASTAKSSLSFLTLEGVAKVDDHTVRFSLARPVVDFAYYLATYQAIILPATYGGNFAAHPDGTGPFKLAEFVPGQRARLVRNPTYWNRPLPYLDGAEFVLGSSSGGQVAALLGGSIDTVVVTDYTTLQIVRANPAFRISTVGSSGHDGIFVRTDTAPFNDVRVRQALGLALDRPAIISNVYQGYGVPGNDNVIAPVFPVYSPIGQRAKDIAKAKALLVAAGHPRGFSTTVLTASDGVVLVALAVALQQQLAPIGVDVSLKTEPSSVYYNTDWLSAPFTVTDWAHRPTPSQFINVAYRSGAVWNASHWSNTTFDALATKLDATIDLGTRKTIARQLEQVQTEQTPALLAFFNQIARPIRNSVQGLTADPSSYLDLSQTYLTK